MNLKSTIQDHPLILLVIVVVTTSAVVWAVATEVLVKPREFQIETLRSQIEQLQRAVDRQVHLAPAQSDSLPPHREAAQRIPPLDETLSSLARGENFSPISMKEYFDTWFDDARTELQRDEFEKGLLGKRVVWTGSVKSVQPGRDERPTLLFHVDGESFNSAHCYFQSTDRALLLGLREGQTIKVTGIIRNIIASPFLDECQVLEKAE